MMCETQFRCVLFDITVYMRQVGGDPSVCLWEGGRAAFLFVYYAGLNTSLFECLSRRLHYYFMFILGGYLLP